LVFGSPQGLWEERPDIILFPTAGGMMAKFENATHRHAWGRLTIISLILAVLVVLFALAIGNDTVGLVSLIPFIIHGIGLARFASDNRSAQAEQLSYA